MTLRITITLRPAPGVDVVLALRALLKIALRRFGPRCESAAFEPPLVDDPLECRVTNKPVHGLIDGDGAGS